MGKIIAFALLAACLFSGALAHDCRRGLLYNKDLYGGDLTGIPNGRSNPTWSPPDCCRMCTITKGCVAFTWDSGTGACWLKGKNHNPQTSKLNLVSKILITDECLSGYEDNTVYDGMLMENGYQTPYPTREICCASCRDLYGCMGITYDKARKSCDLLSEITLITHGSPSYVAKVVL